MKTLRQVLDAQVPQVMEETKNAVDGPKSSKQPTELPDEDPEGSRVANPSSSKHIKSKAMKRRERLRNQASRGGLSIITQHGGQRSTGQLMGKNYHASFRAEKSRLLDQIRIVSAQQDLAN